MCKSNTPSKIELVLTCDEARTLATIVAPCASYDGYHSVLNGVAVSYDQCAGLEFCAADGSRLTHYVTPCDLGQMPAFKYIVPASVFDSVRTAKGDVEMVIEPEREITVTEGKHTSVSRGTVTVNGVTMALIGGEYPRYHELFPVESKFDGLMTPNDALAALCKAAPVLNPRTNLITLTFATDNTIAVRIKTENGGELNDGNVTTHVMELGAPVTVCFNANYLKHAFRLAETVKKDKNGFMTMRVTGAGALKPWVFYSKKHGADLRMLIMPVQAR